VVGEEPESELNNPDPRKDPIRLLNEGDMAGMSGVGGDKDGGLVFSG
jgi:hypothetical protein